MLLKIYLATVALGLITMIVTTIEVKIYAKKVYKDFDIDEETFKKIKTPLSEKILAWIKTILYIITPIYNVILFITLFFPNREEFIKEGIRKSVAKKLYEYDCID